MHYIEDLCSYMSVVICFHISKLNNPMLLRYYNMTHVDAQWPELQQLEVWPKAGKSLF